jgi:hypothetical protein
MKKTPVPLGHQYRKLTKNSNFILLPSAPVVTGEIKCHPGSKEIVHQHDSVNPDTLRGGRIPYSRRGYNLIFSGGISASFPVLPPALENVLLLMRVIQLEKAFALSRRR